MGGGGGEIGLGLDAASSDTDEASGGGDVQGGGVYRIPNGVNGGTAIKPKCIRFYDPRFSTHLTINWQGKRTEIMKAPESSSFIYRGLVFMD